MNKHQFILEEYTGPASRYTCPHCNKRRQFSRYVDTETGGYVGDDVGICNRRDKCGYHYTPKQFFADHSTGQPVKSPVRVAAQIKHCKRVIPLPKQIVSKSLDVASYGRNGFVNFLLQFIDEETVSRLIERYFIGSSNHWPGSTVFWLIDEKRQFVGGQVVLFDTTGHTARINGKRCTTWVHKALERRYKEKEEPPPAWLQEYIENAENYPIPFGLHLAAQEPGKPLAIVEAPKTAVIASAFFPEFVWLAIGSLSWLSEKRLRALAGRQIVLFPDISSNGRAFELWSQKAEELRGLANISVSSFLEEVATEEEKAQGLDLADYLIRSYHPGGPADTPQQEQESDTAPHDPIKVIAGPFLSLEQIKAFLCPQPIRASIHPFRPAPF